MTTDEKKAAPFYMRLEDVMAIESLTAKSLIGPFKDDHDFCLWCHRYFRGQKKEPA